MLNVQKLLYLAAYTSTTLLTLHFRTTLLWKKHHLFMVLSKGSQLHPAPRGWAEQPSPSYHIHQTTPARTAASVLTTGTLSLRYWCTMHHPNTTEELQLSRQFSCGSSFDNNQHHHKRADTFPPESSLLQIGYGRNNLLSCVPEKWRWRKTPHQTQASPMALKGGRKGYDRWWLETKDSFTYASHFWSVWKQLTHSVSSGLKQEHLYERVTEWCLFS